MKHRNLAVAAAVGAFLAISAIGSAHCALPHRHYAGREFYYTVNQYYPPSWCDECGMHWTYVGEKANTRVTTKVKKTAQEAPAAPQEFRSVPPRTY